MIKILEPYRKHVVMTSLSLSLSACVYLIFMSNVVYAPGILKYIPRLLTIDKTVNILIKQFISLIFCFIPLFFIIYSQYKEAKNLTICFYLAFLCFLLIYFFPELLKIYIKYNINIYEFVEWDKHRFQELIINIYYLMLIPLLYLTIQKILNGSLDKIISPTTAATVFTLALTLPFTKLYRLNALPSHIYISYNNIVTTIAVIMQYLMLFFLIRHIIYSLNTKLINLPIIIKSICIYIVLSISWLFFNLLLANLFSFALHRGFSNSFYFFYQLEIIMIFIGALIFFGVLTTIKNKYLNRVFACFIAVIASFFLDKQSGFFMFSKIFFEVALSLAINYLLIRCVFNVTIRGTRTSN